MPFQIQAPFPHDPCAEDMAKKVKRSMTLSSLGSEAAQMDDEKVREAPNAERDLHRLFKKQGLSLPMPIRKIVHTFDDEDPLEFDHVNPSDWLSCLIDKYPCLLAGGEKPVEQQLIGFWELYRFIHPSHKVFEQHSTRLSKVWPLCFFGDEGRGPRRSVYMEGTIECPLGLDENLQPCDCASHLPGLPLHWLPPMPATVESSPNIDAVKYIQSNYKGHSFLKRYLCFSLPGYLYSTRPEIVQTHLKEIAENLASLFETGIEVKGARHYAALIGSKGDLKFQKELAFLTRSYSSMGKKHSLPLCSLCHAGLDEYPMEDVKFEPDWRHSMFLDRPWDESEPPLFLRIPFDSTCPEFLYKLDYFYIFKCGLGRDICGSTLVWLAGLGAWDSEGSTKNLPDRLSRAHAHFKLWAQTEGKCPSLRSFTKAYLNIKSSRSSPWTNSKGSDTTLILQYLRFYVGLLVESQEWKQLPCYDMLGLCRDLLQNSLEMSRLIYSHNLFLERDCAAKLYLHMKIVLRSYKRLAKYFVDQAKAGFRLKPKYHALAHLCYDLRVALKGTSPLVLSPIVWACEQNEDHIGRISRMSRVLATKTLTLRLTQRYFLKSRALFRKHVQARAARKTKRQKFW